MSDDATPSPAEGISGELWAPPTVEETAAPTRTVESPPQHAYQPPPPLDHAITQGIVGAARAQLDAAAESIARYVVNVGTSTPEEVARLVSARVELAAAYGQHLYTVNAARHGHPF